MSWSEMFNKDNFPWIAFCVKLPSCADISVFLTIMGYYIAEMHVMQNAVRAVGLEFALRLPISQFLVEISGFQSTKNFFGWLQP